MSELVHIEGMTLREIIRSRPLGIGILEELTDGAFWKRLDLGAREFCREAGIDPEDLRHRFNALPVKLEHQDWRELPLYFLVDHLSANHSEFRARDLPEIHRLLEDLRLELPNGQGELDALIGEFKDFRRNFSWHMEEEEEFIYPKILRTEANIRHPDLYPEVFKGTLRMFSQIQLHDPEENFHGLVSGLSIRLRGRMSDASQLPAIKKTLAAMQSLEARMRAHTYVESDILFHRALAMEESLLRRAN
jgi:iron-sulfur cluster repair protein YtfE (RIC family)